MKGEKPVRDLYDVIPAPGVYFKCFGEQTSTQDLLDKVIIVERFLIRPSDKTYNDWRSGE